MTEQNERLSIREKVAYGLGDSASNFFYQFAGQFGLFYYTDIFKLSPEEAGTMFLLVRFLDAIIDPIVGIVADRTRSRWGKFRPYLLFGAIPYAALTYLMFANPSIPEGAKLLYAYVTYILAWTAYSVVNIPYSALMGVISPSSEQRTSVSAIRFVCAFIAALVIGTYTVELKDRLGHGNDVEGIRLTMLIYAVISAVLFIITFSQTKERVHPRAEEGSHLLRDLRELVRNRAWVVVLVVGLTLLVGQMIHNTVVIYYFKYAVGDEKAIKAFNYGFIALIAGTFCTKWFLKLGQRRTVLVVLYILVGLLWAGFLWVDPHNLRLLYGLNIAANFLAGPQAAILWAMYAESADYGELKFGNRATALVFSSAIFSQKVGAACGPAFVGWLLGDFGFKADQVQSPGTIHGIILLMSVIPGAFLVLSGILAIFYPLGDADVDRMEIELAGRKAARATA
ncbi:MAG TPA: MFS transporter [Opitutaceae bacterium]|jgi:GPH family glycoside/pentoside/hexuronide:cation symporter